MKNYTFLIKHLTKLEPFLFISFCSIVLLKIINIINISNTLLIIASLSSSIALIILTLYNSNSLPNEEYEYNENEEITSASTFLKRMLELICKLSIIISIFYILFELMESKISKKIFLYSSIYLSVSISACLYFLIKGISNLDLKKKIELITIRLIVIIGLAIIVHFKP